jgi:hypothetical protein
MGYAERFPHLLPSTADTPLVTHMTEGGGVDLHEVSSVLWRERELLELLLFKLEEEQLVLAAGKTRWLTHATREVEMVLEEIRRAELSRSVHVDAAATALGLGADVSLRALAEACPAPWDDIFTEHRKAFLAATQEIEALARANRDLISAGYRAARETLSSIGGQDVQLYDPKGQSVARATGPRLINEAI